MSWLSKIWNSLFDCVPEHELKGIKLNFANCWRIDVKKTDITTFIKAMPKLFSDNSIIYLEGTSIVSEIQEYLRSNYAEQITKVAMGTICPRPAIFHISSSEENLQKLAEFTDNYALPEVCDHLIVYNGEEVLLEGYDFFNQEVYLSGKIDENTVRFFCETVGCTYKRFKTG